MFTAIIPAFNEEKHLASTLKYIPSFVEQIIVVDDGSSDNTFEVAKKISEKIPRILVLRNKQNMGKGVSMRKAVNYAKFEKLIFLDASQFYPADLLKFKNLKKGEMLVGQRSPAKIPIYRQITNFLSNLAIKTATGKACADCLCGLRAITKSDFEKLNLEENRYAIEPEMIYKALKNELKLYFIPIRINYTNMPTSIMNFESNWQIIKFLIKANLGMIK